MNISIRIDGLKSLMRSLDPSVAKRAANSALKKIAAQAKTEASSVIRDRYNIKKADLDRKIALRPPIRTGELTAELSLVSRPIALPYFGARQTVGNRVITRQGVRLLKRPRTPSAGGVTYQILKSGGKKRRAHAFMATMQSGHVGVFERVGKGRLGIREVAMVTPSTLFGSKRTRDAINRLVQRKFDDIFRHEIDYFMSKVR